MKSSKSGDIVLDLFGVAGSTLIGCGRRGRKAHLMEIDPKYADVIVRRYQDYSGQPAVLFLRVAGADIGVVEKMPERLEFAARHHGLQRYYPSHEEARQEEASMLVFDCTGDQGLMEGAIHLLQQGGTLVFVGLINNTISLFDPDLHRREATILASRNSTPAEHHRRAGTDGERAD